MEYDIIESDVMQELIDQVNARLAEEWKCQGGLVLVASEHQGINWYLQAMVREGKLWEARTESKQTK
jgi:hypothetical protein